MPDTYALYRSMSARPFGKRAFSLLFANKAPYFRTVRPQVRDVRPHHAELTIRKRRAVQNHIGTLHAIAVCNGLEAAMGALNLPSAADLERLADEGDTLEVVGKLGAIVREPKRVDPPQLSDTGSYRIVGEAATRCSRSSLAASSAAGSRTLRSSTRSRKPGANRSS